MTLTLTIAKFKNVAFASGTSTNSASYLIRKRKLVIKFVKALKKLKPWFLVKTKDLPVHFTMTKVKSLFVMLGGG